MSLSFSSLLSRYEESAHVSQFPPGTIRVWIQYTSLETSVFVPLTKHRYIRQQQQSNELTASQLLLTWPLSTWIYVVVVSETSTTTTMKSLHPVVWGYISVAELMYDRIAHLYKEYPEQPIYTHRLVYRSRCSLYPPILYPPLTTTTKLFPSVLPFDPPSIEISIDQFLAHVHHRFVWCVHQINQDPPAQVEKRNEWSITQSQQMKQDHIRFQLFRLSWAKFCPSSALLSTLTPFIVEYEVALFSYRLHTCWLPYWYTIWKQLMVHLSIPYQERFFGGLIPEVLSERQDSPYKGYTQWWTMDFEHVQPAMWRQYKVWIEQGNIWLHEAHLYAMLPYYYRLCLMKDAFHDQWWVSLTNYTSEQVDNGVRSSGIERLFRFLVNKLLVGGGNITVAMPCAISYLAKYGPKCIQQMIGSIQFRVGTEARHYKNDQRQMIYSALLRSGVSARELTEFMIPYIRRQYLHQEMISLKIKKCITDIQGWTKRPLQIQYSCHRYIIEGMCGYKDQWMTMVRDIEDLTDEKKTTTTTEEPRIIENSQQRIKPQQQCTMDLCQSCSAYPKTMNRTAMMMYPSQFISLYNQYR